MVHIEVPFVDAHPIEDTQGTGCYNSLPLPPSMWCVSYQQLMQLGELAKERFKEQDEYATTTTTRDVCRELVEPVCRATGKPYALTLNPQGLHIDVFVTHSWDGNFASMIKSITL